MKELLEAVKAWAVTPRGSVEEDEASSDLLNALVAYEAVQKDDPIQMIQAGDDDSIAIVRYVTSDPSDDSPVESTTMVYVGGVDLINTHIQDDSEGDAETVIEDVMLLFTDRQPEDFGF